MSTPLPSTGAYQTVYQPNVVYTVPPEQYTVPPQQYFVPAEQYSVIPPQQYTPLEQTPEKPARFAGSSGCRDWFFAVLFLAHLIGIFVIFGIGLNSPDNIEYVGMFPELNPGEALSLLTVIGILACGGIVIASMAIQYARLAPKGFIYFSLLFNFAAFAGVAIYSAIYRSWAFTIVFAIGLLIWILFFISIRIWIPFAAEVVGTVAAVTSAYPSTFLLSVFNAVLQVGWIIFWLYTLMLVQYRFSAPAIRGLMAFLVLSLFWTYQTIKNITHTTNSGFIATWYFMSGTYGMPKYPVLGSLRRALTTSFGSICWGSLFVAILQTMRTLLRGSRNSRNILSVIAACFLACFEELAKYFNTYAFTYCAIYGMSFIQAAKSVFDLFRRSGFEAIVNDSLFDKILFTSSMMGAMIVGALGYFLGPVFNVSPRNVLIITAIGFVLGWTILALVFQVIQSGIVTIFVCFCEDKEALQRNQPVLYERIMETYGGQLLVNNNA